MPTRFFSRCAECGERLAHDQRYCVACGSRRGPLPPAVAALIRGASAPPPSPAATSARARAWFPSARATAVAVMGVLAFGVIVGSAVAPPAESAPAEQVIVAMNPPTAPSPVATPTAAPTPEPTPAPTSAPVVAGAPTAAATPAPTPTPTPTPAKTPKPKRTGLPKVKHVFLIVLAEHGYSQTFGDPGADPYLAKTLAGHGEVVPNYYGVTQGELANEIALISGQGPTPQTAANCPTYTDVTPGTVSDGGQIAGDGCVYPAPAQTLADQLTAAGKSWKAYAEDMGNGPATDPTTCRRPALGAADANVLPRPGDAYVTWRNPFAYFHSLDDDCPNDEVGLDQLSFDLTSPDTTPALSYIVPNRCHDGSETPCAPGQPAGLAASDDFLKTIVPKIEASAAYRQDGLIAITFDQAPQAGPDGDAGSCCNQPAAYPNLPAPAATPAPGAAPTATPVATPTTTATATATSTATPAPGVPAGGGQVGLLLISSRFVKPGTTYGFGSFNHFSLLRSVEDLFGLVHLGYAADPTVPAFDNSVYNKG